MGFDVHGMEPKKNKVNMDDFKVYNKYNSMDFKKKWEELDKDKKLREQFWEEQQAWQDINPGVYFRNNVWWWRPLWDYVCKHCDDILTEEDMELGCENSGHLINKEKAAKIGVKLQSLIMSGATKEWKEGYDKEVAGLPKEPCFRCNGNNHGHNKKKECKSCDKTGERENWQASYPFDVENVERFSQFCLESGGFEIS